MVEGYIAHLTEGRVRIKFSTQRGNEEFFSELIEKLRSENFTNLKANVYTGSLIIEHDRSHQEILEQLKSYPYFKITNSIKETPSHKIIKSVKKNFAYADNLLKKVSSESLDLKSAILIFLIISSLYQIARGNITSIPWYAALFYLHALISKK